MGHDERDGRAGDGPTDMTADNIAPEDVPTREPANTQVPADGDENEEDE
jgi:hypothetical protein